MLNGKLCKINKNKSFASDEALLVVQDDVVRTRDPVCVWEVVFQGGSAHEDAEDQQQDGGDQAADEERHGKQVRKLHCYHQV